MYFSATWFHSVIIANASLPVHPRMHLSGKPSVKRHPASAFVGRAVIVLLLLSQPFIDGCSERAAEHTVVRATDGEIRLPVSTFSDGKVHFYTYRKSGKNINFFVRTDGSGNLSTHFDACYACYKKKKGYRQEGTDLVCNECGLRFRLADEKWLHEGCSPIPLTSRDEKGFIVIKTVDLEAGKRLF